MSTNNQIIIFFNFLYDNDFGLMIDIYFYETLSTPNFEKKRLRFNL
jgi:hypothetical protein